MKIPLIRWKSKWKQRKNQNINREKIKMKIEEESKYKWRKNQNINREKIKMKREEESKWKRKWRMNQNENGERSNHCQPWHRPTQNTIKPNTGKEINVTLSCKYLPMVELYVPRYHFLKISNLVEVDRIYAILCTTVH